MSGSTMLSELIDDGTNLSPKNTRGLESNVTTGTPPLVVASTTEVANLKAATVSTITGLAPDTATTQATQPNITSAATLPWTGLKPGTDGEVPTFDASGNPSFAAAGTAAQVFTSNGAGAAPTFQVATVGTITGLAPDTATTQATQPNITTATGLPWTGMKTGTDGEVPTFDASGNPAFAAAGTAAQVFTSNGAGAAPTFQDAAGGGAGINVEALTAGKTLVGGTDDQYQYLDPGASIRIITLDDTTSTTGSVFNIYNNVAYSSSRYLSVLDGVAGTELTKLYAGSHGWYVYDGTNWQPQTNSSGNVDTSKANNTSYGNDARATGLQSTVIGGEASGSGNYSVIVGHVSIATGTHVTSIGYNTSAASFSYSTLLGNGASSGDFYSIGLGYSTHTERYGEFVIAGDTANPNKHLKGQAQWNGVTADATPLEIYLRGTASNRFTILATSVVAFNILVTARDSTSGDSAAYQIVGSIKRDGSSNTALLGTPTLTVLGEDDASWTVAATADDTNEALVITVTGDATNSVDWTATADYCEVRT